MSTDLNQKIYVAGHRGMVGSAIVRRLQWEGCEVLTVGRSDLDLRRQGPTEQWIAEHRPDAIVLAAARVGGILVNDQRPADFLHDNLVIQTNVLEAAYRVGTSRVLVLGSSCIYPRSAPQPIVEEALLTGPLEATNAWYAVAKIAGIKLAQAYRRQHGCDFISAMPTNLYGPGDNFDLETSHVLPALIRKAHEARVTGAPALTIWGTGSPRREFLHVEDCADALVHLLKVYTGEMHINVGSGDDLTIRDLADLVCDVVGYRGPILCDARKPDGTPRKLMSADRIRAMGWRPTIPLREGIVSTYQWFLSHAL